MSSEIQPFEFEGNKVRALADGDEVMFVASDIAKILGYRDAANLARNLDDDERGIHEVSTPSGTQNMTVLTESGLYRSILNREIAYVKEPEAQAFVKRFQRWVTHEVLPQIRRTGGYIPTTDVDDDMTILAKAVMIGQRTMEAQKRRIAEQQSRIVELEPKALFADAVAASDGTCLVGELAKMLRQNGLNIGQNRLFQLLRDDGFFGKSGSNRNVPTQKAMDLGLFRIKETAVTHSDGHVTISRTPKVTGKGQRYFIARYCPKKKPND
ncbi:phage antirepressor KilAC domain-containing protein [Bifidobacterium adolescentis]